MKNRIDETASARLHRLMLSKQIKDISAECEYWKSVTRELIRIHLVDDQVFDPEKETDKRMANLETSLRIVGKSRWT